MHPLENNGAMANLSNTRPGLNNDQSSFVYDSLLDNQPLLNNAEYFTHNDEHVGEGILFLFSGLDLSLRRALSVVSTPNSELSPNQLVDASPRDPLENTHQIPTPSSQGKINLETRIEPARQPHRQ